MARWERCASFTRQDRQTRLFRQRDLIRAQMLRFSCAAAVRKKKYTAACLGKRRLWRQREVHGRAVDEKGVKAGNFKADQCSSLLPFLPRCMSVVRIQATMLLCKLLRNSLSLCLLETTPLYNGLHRYCLCCFSSVQADRFDILYIPGPRGALVNRCVCGW